MKYTVGDIVTMKQTRGGWEGVVTRVVESGPMPVYQVIEPGFTEQSAQTKVREIDIASAHQEYPNYQVGQQVQLNKRPGEITAINELTYTVEQDIPRKRPRTSQGYVVFHHIHHIPRWRLWLENPGF